MDSKQQQSGTAALSICESLLISLVDSGVISEAEARGILEDAASAHRHAAAQAENPDWHRSIAALIMTLTKTSS